MAYPIWWPQQMVYPSVGSLAEVREMRSLHSSVGHDVPYLCVFPAVSLYYVDTACCYR